MVYEVLYEPLETFNGNITDQKINTTTQFITLMGLEEFTNYSISVRGYTNVGPGNYSVPILAMTFEDGKFNIVHNMSRKHCYIMSIVYSSGHWSYQCAVSGVVLHLH